MFCLQQIPLVAFFIAQDKQGMTAGHYAASKADAKSLAGLLAAGAVVDDQGGASSVQFNSKLSLS